MLRFTCLHKSQIVSISEYACTSCKGGPGVEEHSADNQLVLMRHGVFRRHFGRQSATSDVNQVSFFAKGSSYQVSHPANCGDRGTVLQLAQETLCDIAEQSNPTVRDDPDKAFPLQVTPCDALTFQLHQNLVDLLNGPVDLLNPIQVDELVIDLFSRVLQSAYERVGLNAASKESHTTKRHRDLAEDAVSLLGSQFTEKLTLQQIANELECSPFHLARVFRNYTGIPVHRYLTSLRLRTSLDRINDGAENLTQLAMNLGFSSHSHFSDAFRKEFGCSPSSVRDGLKHPREQDFDSGSEGK